MNRATIYTAPWVLPVASPMLADGAVVVAAGRIADVGSRHDMLRSWSGARHVELEGLLMPALVNCHMHLELSWIGTIRRPGTDDSMTDWIGELLEKRAQLNPDDQAVAVAAGEELERQHRSGVVLIADIGNAPRNSSGAAVLPEVVAIHEVLAPTAIRTSEILAELENLPADRPVSPHSPYSSSPELIQAVKNRCSLFSHPFSIHTAESGDEIDFIRQKSGPFRQLLESRGMWDGVFAARGSYKGSVDYLEALGVLDEQTLCVHCVHVSDEEIDLLAKRGAKVCLCPGSNTFLRVGKAPLEKMLAAGLLPAIGTDSIASNDTLDLWREVGMLRSHYPAVDASSLLAMATLGGARALGREGDFGTLEKGKKGLFLHVVPDGQTAGAIDVEEQLVAGKPKTINWITG